MKKFRRIISYKTISSIRSLNFWIRSKEFASPIFAKNKDEKLKFIRITTFRLQVREFSRNRGYKSRKRGDKRQNVIS